MYRSRSFIGLSREMVLSTEMPVSQYGAPSRDPRWRSYPSRSRHPTTGMANFGETNLVKIGLSPKGFDNLCISNGLTELQPAPQPGAIRSDRCGNATST